MPRRSELGWILAMVVVAVTLGFFIGGGPTLLTSSADEGVVEAVGAAPTTSTTTTALEVSTSTTAAPPNTTTAAARPPQEVSVRVYNGSTKPGQAVRVGDRLKAVGYEVLAPGPSPGDPLTASIVHFAEGYFNEAVALATMMGLPSAAAAPAPIPPLVPGGAPAKLVLIVADDLAVSP